ncbi:MAG: cobalamin biosynthesis protein CobD [Spirochaetaceae bacterium]|nr:cobalamin biosynthesis protein CobD [Spirochaetaceae bacterium]
MKYHLLAFCAGFLLDLAFGDPYWLPHPVRAIGKLISVLEKMLYGKKHSRFRGFVLVLLVCLAVELCVFAVLAAGYMVHPVLGCVLETMMTYQLLAAKCLKVESMKVYKKLEHGTIEEARKAVSMIVGRDTENLTAEEVAKAAVETVAENTSDGVIAPMLYTALGGPVLGFLYKAINTMDSMVAYKNERYIAFGFFAAKTDDAANFVPSRISALLMIFACAFLGRSFSFKNAWRIYKRDRFNHESPNSAQTESACAGALGLRLAGPASYAGIIENKPFIGDETRKIENADIKRANKLMFAASFVCEGLCAAIMLAIILAGVH